MKKYLLFTVFTLLVLTTKAQKEINGCIVTLKESNDNNFIFSNDTITVTFGPSEFFWYVNIKNNINDDISIVWDKSSFVLNGRASKIIFDNTINFKKDEPIPDQEIPSRSFIDKKIFPVDNMEFSSPTISRRFVKKRYEETGNPDTVKLVLAFNINGELHKLDFNFEIVPKQKK
ncbi:hypothetical protein [Albibacterium profundi]|uniref:Uncharacterized protein n=1 Tax=Albibacterium profundi TaxID=3134906 RepID=A0ABV5CEW2_9SPHI